MTDKAREEFETAFRTEGQFKAMSSAALDSMLERGSDGEYRSVRVHGAWWGWQASRAALVVTLPSVRPEPTSSGDALQSDGEAATWNIWVGEKLAKAECREAIEAAGLKVAP